MPERAQRWRLEPEAMEILAGYGVPFPAHALVKTGPEAAAAANRLGYPVVLKVVSPGVVHKSEAGGVMTGLEDEPALTAGFERLLDRVKARTPEAEIEGVLVCRQAGEGVEVIVGAIHDQVFGPTIMCGLGGIFTEVMKDTAFRVAPVDRLEARRMIAELKAYPLLAGARGRPPADVEALACLLTIVSRLALERTDLRELDLNPVRVFEKGLLALDARLMLGSEPARWA